jgi:hypothetical protein
MINIGTYEDPDYEKEMWPLIIERIELSGFFNTNSIISTIKENYTVSTILSFPKSEPFLNKEELKANGLSLNTKINREYYYSLTGKGKAISKDPKSVLTIIFAQAVTTRSAQKTIATTQNLNGIGVILNVSPYCDKYEKLNNSYYELGAQPKIVCSDCISRAGCFFASVNYKEEIPTNITYKGKNE